MHLNRTWRHFKKMNENTNNWVCKKIRRKKLGGKLVSDKFWETEYSVILDAGVHMKKRTHQGSTMKKGLALPFLTKEWLLGTSLPFLVFTMSVSLLIGVCVSLNQQYVPERWVQICYSGHGLLHFSLEKWIFSLSLFWNCASLLQANFKIFHLLNWIC